MHLFFFHCVTKNKLNPQKPVIINAKEFYENPKLLGGGFKFEGRGKKQKGGGRC
jgi:hypothetical protein